MFNVGVDVGGTFTDAVAIDEAGNLYVGKAPTTPRRIAKGVMDSLHDAARNAGLDLTELLAATRFLGHGTTVGTNALVTRGGARVGLLITAGFEDTPFIQRAIGRIAGLSDEEMRQQVSLRQPVPLVARDCIVGVLERVDSTGNVLVPLSETEAVRCVSALLEQGVEAIAICLLWSFLNPSHELMLADVVRRIAPAMQLSVSCELAPKIRENARCNTVVIDAFIRGKVHDYLGDLRDQLAQQGFRQSLASMQCFGGVTDSRHASPISTIDSGPVGGVMGSKRLAGLLGENNVITTDVGGTTFDVSVIARGEENLAREYFGAAGVIERFEVLTPRVDILSIGAGGGTIAWFDKASNTIKFGPHSAGSEPGPVFYGAGGTQVTLADAWLTLGYLDSARFLGGRLKVDAEAAGLAIEQQLARPLGISPTQAALAVVELANHHMSDAIKVYLAARGLDVSEFVMFAFGGGGPMHAAAYGEICGVRKTYLVANAGVFSAFGIALADTKHRQQVTLFAREPFDVDAIIHSFADLESRLMAQFEREGLPPGQIQKRYFVDLRYQGQFHELTIEIPDPRSFEGGSQALRRRFEEHYQAVYGAAPSVYSKLELVGLGVDGIAETPKPSLRRSQTSERPAVAVKYRQACFDAADGYRAVAVFSHRDLLASQRIPGPAFVEDDYLTMIILPAQTGIVDALGNVVIHHSERSFDAA